MADNDEPQIFKKRYKVDKKLGAGNFGTAYLVTDRKEKNDPKVLKVVRLGEMDSEQTVDSVREAELLSNLDNEYIVKFHESFLENDCLCIVTEYCEGGDLDQRLKELKKQNQPLDEDQVVEWLIQILIAVQYMHKCKVLHRDLKAKNIFLKSNKVKIGDFGISRVLAGTMEFATTFTGTPYYMSPEVMKHDGYESKSDIWSVGCLLYEMCAFQHAFDGKGLMNVIYKVVEGKAPDIPKTYSKELSDLLKKMFIKDPKNRPSAIQLLGTPFMIGHRQRTKLTGPLQDTIDGNLRSNQINTLFQSPKTSGHMKNTSWSISSKDHIADDGDDAQPDNIPTSQHIEEEEEAEEEQEQTLKPGNTLNRAKQAMVEKKMREADARGQLFTQAIRSNAVEGNQSRPMMRENTTIGPSRQARTGAANGPIRSHDDRPITPMRTSYQQVGEKFGDEDVRQHDNRSPTRDRGSNELTLKNNRALSASQRSTLNSMSQTINPRHAANYQQQQKYASPSRTIGSASRQRASMNASKDDGNATLKDNPNRDAFGPLAKDAKINTLRTKAIQLLGESTFEKVYDYLVKQRTAQKANPNLDEAKITQGLSAFVKNPGDCFLVDQLVFLELIS